MSSLIHSRAWQSLLLGLVLSSASVLSGQAFDRYRPQIPESTEGQSRLPDLPGEVTGDTKILVDQLKAIIFVDHRDSVMPEGAAGTGIEVRSTGLGLLRSNQFQQAMQRYLGQPVSMRSLNEIVRETIVFYRNNDQPVVDVSIPEQKITTGVVQIVVTESRLGLVRVQGAHYFNPHVLVNQTHLYSGERIYESSLLEELEWLNRNPFREVDLTIEPGEEFGTTDVVFNVRDERPVRVYAGYEDTGVRLTGLERTIYGVNWGNAFNRDHQLGYQYTASSDFNSLSAHSLVYEMPFHNRDTLVMYGTYAQVRSRVAVPFATDGHAGQVGFRYNYNLCPRGCYEHRLSFGVDVKNTNTNLTFGGLLASASGVDVLDFVLGYYGSQQTWWGSWGIGIEGVYGPSGILGGNNSTSYQQLRFAAQGDYMFGRAFAQTTVNLTQYFDLFARVRGQLADGNLLPIEQMAFGGYDSIRGYDMYLNTGDSGVIANVELRTVPISLLGKCDEFQLLAFFDYGDAYNHTLLPGEDPSVDFSSVGVGCRFAMTPRIGLRVDYGWQLSEFQFQPDPRQRVHIGVIAAY